MKYDCREIGLARVYCGDNRDLLDEVLPEVGAILTDPPYGIGIAHYNTVGQRAARLDHRIKNYKRSHWDDETPDIDWIFHGELPAIVWGGNYFTTPRHRCGLVWDKHNEGRSFADFEYAWTNLDQASRKLTYRNSGGASPIQKTEGPKRHQAQKPLEVIKWCLSFLPKDVVILDPYAGVGTTSVMCSMMGIKSISIEIDRDYCDIACSRLDELQGDMFGFVEGKHAATAS